MIHESFVIQYVNELHRVCFFPLPVTHFHQSDNNEKQFVPVAVLL